MQSAPTSKRNYCPYVHTKVRQTFPPHFFVHDECEQLCCRYLSAPTTEVPLRGLQRGWCHISFCLLSWSSRKVKGRLARHQSHQSASVTNYYRGPRPHGLISPLNKLRGQRQRIFLVLELHVCPAQEVMFNSLKYPTRKSSLSIQTLSHIRCLQRVSCLYRYSNKSKRFCLIFERIKALIVI